MLKLRDMMTTDVIALTPQTCLRDALETLGKRHVSGAPVVSGDRLVGVVTTTDLMNLAAALPGVPTEREATGEWGVWDDEASAEAEAERENEPASAYFAEFWDDAGAEVVERASRVEGPEWDVLEEHDVEEAMTHAPLVTLPPSADVEAAARLMTEKGIHRVLVLDGDKLVGIVSALDVAKAVAQHRVVRRRFAFNRDADFRDNDR
jgi:CBS domain-containing protein